MKLNRNKVEQIIRKLKIAEQLIAQGKTVIELCRVMGVTKPPYHRWRQQYDGMQAEEIRRLTQLEKGERPALAEGFSEEVEASGEGRAGEGDAEASRRGKLPSPERRWRAVTVLQVR